MKSLFLKNHTILFKKLYYFKKLIFSENYGYVRLLCPFLNHVTFIWNISQYFPFFELLWCESWNETLYISIKRNL